MAKSVVGLFDEKANIDSVIRDLDRIGVPRRHVHALARADAQEHPGRSWTDRVAAFFGFSGQTHERELGAEYADAMNEGDTLLIADVEDPMADRTAALMNQHGAVDVGARTRERAARKSAEAAAQQQPAASAAQQKAEPRRAPPPPESQTISTRAQTTTGPVIQEELEIGKRTVERGGVRVHTHVEQMPMAEVIRLREEHVEVERHTVSRSAAPGDTFEMITIEVTETTEESVVAKQAQVVEEVVVAQKSEEHDETSADTVRRREVDVEPLPKTGTGGRR